MYVKKISNKKNNDEHSNHALATFGDSILKAILSQNLYEEGKNRGEITSDKSKLENNKVLYRIVNDVDTPIINFAFHDSSFYKDQTNEEKVSNSTHSQYLEAIVAAIYLDSSFEKARNWVNEWLLPKMKKYEKNND
jgi:dsRNA-specific ribonuclease